MSSPTLLYEFNSFRIDVTQRLLLCDNKLVHLTLKEFAVLLMLVQNSDRVVEKEEFLRKIWNDTFVEEQNLTQNIFTLRRVLGTDLNGNRYIETVPKRGYRFVVPVEEIQASSINSKVKHPGKTSLAVLPLTNASNDPDLEYLSDSITARIIKTISLLPRLRVKAHCLITRYKGKNLNPQEIGHDLNTQIVLTGIVFKIEDNLVVRTELIDVESGYHLWGAQYKRKLIDIFRVQEDITKEISKDLRTWLAKLIHQSSQ